MKLKADEVLEKDRKTFEDVHGYRVVLQNSTWDF